MDLRITAGRDRAAAIPQQDAVAGRRVDEIVGDDRPRHVQAGDGVVEAARQVEPGDGMDDAAALSQLYPEYDFALLPRRAWAAGLVLTWPALEVVAIRARSRVASAEEDVARANALEVAQAVADELQKAQG